MPTYFSKKLKNLRKSRDLTQEQIADTFHVSPQAVSRWETGATYPDVAMLPHIAIFFKITVDELLGTEAILGEEKAVGYIRDIRNLLNVGKLNDAIDTARKAVKEYPINPDLHYHLLESLCVACSNEAPESKDKTEKLKSEIIAMGKWIMNCTDQNAYLGHKYRLIMQYAYWGMKEEATKIVFSLPTEAYFTQDLTLRYVLEGDALQKDLKLRIVRFSIMLCDFIKDYAHSSDLDILQKIECIKTAMQIETLTSPISGVNDGGVDRINNAFQNINIAEMYCEIGNIENALIHVEKATQDAMHHIDIMYKTNGDGSNYLPWSTSRNLCWILWEDLLIKPPFDSIRSSQRFIECFELLKNNSHELK